MKLKYKNLDLVDQKKKKYSIPGDDGILVKILTNYLYLKLLRFFFSGNSLKLNGLYLYRS